MQSVDHYSLPTATDSERLLSNITSDDPLTEIASADELQPTITEVEGPIPRFVPIDQSIVLPRGDSQDPHFLTNIDQPDTSRQDFVEGTVTNSHPPLNPISGPNKRNENKKACLKQLPPTQKPQKQDSGPNLLPPLSRLPPTAGLPYYHEQSYPSLVQMSHPTELHPSSTSLNPQTNPLLVHVPPGGYQLTRPVLEDHLSFQQCPCYLTHGFIPHSAPPYQQVYVPLQPGSAPYAPLTGTGQDTLVYPDMYSGPRQTLIPTQSYPNIDHIFPYDPNCQRPSIFIPYAVQEALTTLQPPVSAPSGKTKTHRTSKKEALRKRDLETATKSSEDPSMIKKSKVDPVVPQTVPGEMLLQQAPHSSMTTAPHYRTDNILPCISANFNPFYPQFVPTANSFYQQGHVPYYQQHMIEPEKRQQSRRALFQFQGAPPSEDSLGVQPLENTPQTKMSPTSTSITTPEVDTNSASQISKNSDHPCIIQQNSGNNTLLRQNRANIPPPISLPPHINNFVNSDTIS
ncbi:hypothetical protein LOD99_14271 [Oopsacas minuta]|uniref:Uncharacterized protein n=1 Tax=Oopsacas minuta TaxID=111878 RepID=A0AAV7KES6_9METZ|nr:hypothetical protein LOD99_14271 [Oopsacas minuta]